jgi:hypothetical protein
LLPYEFDHALCSPASMRDAIFFFITHLGKCFAVRLNPHDGVKTKTVTALSFVRDEP